MINPQDVNRSPRSFFMHLILEFTILFKLQTEVNREKTVDDPGEIRIRNSFTAILDFFGKLGYLMDIGAITRRDLGYFEYFEYYIYESSKNPAIITFTGIYSFEFQLYAVLLDKVGLTPSKLKGLATDYYQRNKRLFRRSYFE